MENHLLQILYVIIAKCPVCGYERVDVSVRSDTDMVCCCASVYDRKQKRLVIAEECYYGTYAHLVKG